MHAPHRTVTALLLIAPLCLWTACGKKSAPTAPGGGGNHNPTISVNTNRLKLNPHDQVAITVVASDPDGDQLTYAYTATGGTISASGPTATTATFTAGAQPGPASVTAAASDGHGGAANGTASMYIRDPAPAVTFGGSGSLNCDRLRIRATGACTLTSITVWVGNNSYTGEVLDVTPPITMASGDVVIVGTAGGGCWNMTSYQVMWATVWGTRAEPDGGQFQATYYWHI